MGAADDFLQSLLKSHPEIASGKLGEDQLGKLISGISKRSTVQGSKILMVLVLNR